MSAKDKRDVERCQETAPWTHERCALEAGHEGPHQRSAPPKR